VVAVEVSAAMLALARCKAQAARTANVEFVHAGFLTYTHQGDPADMAYSRNAMHQLPDFWKVMALQRIAATLHLGGILRLRDLVYSFDPTEAAGRLNAWLAAAPSDPARGWTADELATHIRAEYSTYSWLLESMLERVGFRHHPPGLLAVADLRRLRLRAPPRPTAEARMRRARRSRATSSIRQFRLPVRGMSGRSGIRYRPTRATTSGSSSLGSRICPSPVTGVSMPEHQARRKPWEAIQ
jgi:SAM-dependent methyltransferase